MKRAALITALILVTGCASQAPQESMLARSDGSLKALKAQAQRESVEQCLKDATRAYPNVPSYTIWDACYAAAGYPQMTQRINRF